MSEQRNNGFSISFRKDDGVVEHNNRHFIAKNVDRARIADNITYVSENLRDFYNNVFGQALDDFNSKQTRKDRVITDYYEHIRKSKQEKLYEEIVVQFGDMQDCGIGSENWKTAKTMLDEYMREFEKRNPNLKVFNAVILKWQHSLYIQIACSRDEVLFVGVLARKLIADKVTSVVQIISVNHTHILDGLPTARLDHSD